MGCSVHARYEAGVRVTGRHGAQTILNRNLFGKLQLFLKLYFVLKFAHFMICFY